jgi:DnaJ homolog subfamily C member 28
MSDGPDKQRSAKRVDADGNVQYGPNWDTLIERQIRDAMDTGKFKDLPNQGGRLPLDDNPYAGERDMAFHILRNAGVAPPWVEADKEVRELLAQRDKILQRVSSGLIPTSIQRERDRRAIGEIVAHANGAIAKVNMESPTPAQHRKRLDLDEELARYEAACARC